VNDAVGLPVFAGTDDQRDRVGHREDRAVG
jgi:hypothetical protein